LDQVEEELTQRLRLAESKMKGNWKQSLNRRISSVLKELDEIALSMTSDSQIMTHREWLEVEVKRLSDKLGQVEQLDYFTYPGGDRFNHTLFFMDRNNDEKLRQVTDLRLDFSLQYFVQVGKSALTFSNSYQQFVNVTHYANPTDSLLLQK